MKIRTDVFEDGNYYLYISINVGLPVFIAKLIVEKYPSKYHYSSIDPFGVRVYGNSYSLEIKGLSEEEIIKEKKKLICELKQTLYKDILRELERYVNKLKGELKCMKY